ncbi:glycosyltransferase [Methylobacterium sp. ID0610]
MSLAHQLRNHNTCDSTVAICTYNRIATLPRTIEALSRLRGEYSFEIIVVNGPSTDGTTEFLKTSKNVRVFDNPEPNLAVSRNIAIANARGRYIAFIDDDAVPEFDWLSLLIKKLDSNTDIVALGGFIRDANGINFQAKYVYCDVFGKGYPCENAEYVVFPSKGKRMYLSLTGTNVIYRVDALKRINGFDEIFAYFLDETDVNKRMDDLGLRCEMLPDAEIHHKYAPSHLRTAKKVATNMFPTARSIAYFAMRHGVPEVGWDEAVKRLSQFYSDEYIWKIDSLVRGEIDREQFEALMYQSAQGIIAGIDYYFDNLHLSHENRLSKYHSIESPVVHRSMKRDSDVLRLCMFSQDHSHERSGGIGRWTNLVAKGLAERGNEITVIGDISCSDQQEYCDFNSNNFWSHNVGCFEKADSLEIDCLGLPPSLANTSKRKFSEMRRIMPRRQFQVASSPIWDVEGAAAIGSGSVPVVLSLHTCAGLMLDSKPEWKLDESYYNNHVLRVISAEIQALKRAPLILANSNAIMKDIGNLYDMDLYSKAHAIVPHGIEDIDNGENVLQQREAEREADIESPIRILFVGRLETRKGIKDLVAIARALLHENINIHLDIVGEKVDEVNSKIVDQLVEQYPDRVIRHNYLSSFELDNLMRRSDVFFAPSLYESFGLIYAEAMRCSVPSVAYSTGGVPEVISDGVDGFLAELHNQQDLYMKMKQIVLNKELRSQMSRAARFSFSSRFHYKIMAEKLEIVYKEIAEIHRYSKFVSQNSAF